VVRRVLRSWWLILGMNLGFHEMSWGIWCSASVLLRRSMDRSKAMPMRDCVAAGHLHGAGIFCWTWD
jgi:hypothetical protein